MVEGRFLPNFDPSLKLPAEPIVDRAHETAPVVAVPIEEIAQLVHHHGREQQIAPHGRVSFPQILHVGGRELEIDHYLAQRLALPEQSKRFCRDVAGRAAWSIAAHCSRGTAVPLLEVFSELLNLHRIETLVPPKVPARN